MYGIWIDFTKILDGLFRSPSQFAFYSTFLYEIHIKNWNNIPVNPTNQLGRKRGPKNLLMAIHFYRINNEWALTTAQTNDRWMQNTIKTKHCARIQFLMDLTSTDEHWIETTTTKWNIEKCSNQCFGVRCVWHIICTIDCEENGKNRCDFQNEIHPFNFITDKGDSQHTIETRLPQKHALNVFDCMHQVCTPPSYYCCRFIILIRKAIAHTHTKCIYINRNNTCCVNDGKYWNNNFVAVCFIIVRVIHVSITMYDCRTLHGGVVLMAILFSTPSRQLSWRTKG